MKEYRQEHAKPDGKIYVYFWVCSAHGASTKTAAITPALPLHMIWNDKTVGMAIDVQPVSGKAGVADALSLEIYQMEPQWTLDEVMAWAKPGGAGFNLINGRPHQLLFASIDGRGNKPVES